jgi:hypothetical protein
LKYAETDSRFSGIMTSSFNNPNAWVMALTRIGEVNRMTISISLDAEVMSGLEHHAKERRLSVEELATQILTNAVFETESTTPEEVVVKIRAKGPNPSQVVMPLKSLSEVLATPGDGDPIAPMNGTDSGQSSKRS